MSATGYTITRELVIGRETWIERDRHGVVAIGPVRDSLPHGRSPR